MGTVPSYIYFPVPQISGDQNQMSSTKLFSQKTVANQMGMASAFRELTRRTEPFNFGPFIFEINLPIYYTILSYIIHHVIFYILHYKLF